MLSDIRSFFGLTREIALTGQSTYFETPQSQHIIKELKLAIKDGKLIVLAGIVGTGKTTTLRKIQEALEEDKEILVAKALSVDGGQISLGTLMLALFCDLTTAKDDPMPTQTEKRERALRTLIRKRKKPVVLFIDDAHQLHPKTLIGLKRLMEIVRDGKGTLSIVLAGHPKLKNDLLRPSMEEIGARTTLFELDGFGTDKKKYLTWLLTQITAPRIKQETLLTDAAAALLCERLTTPLQFELYLTRAFEEAFRIGQKPVDVDTINAIMAPEFDGLEARLTRNGYHARALTDMLGARPKEIRAFLGGHLPPERTQEFHDRLLAAGVPM